MRPAHGLGLRMVQLVLANLLHGLTWRLPDGVVPEKLSMEEKFGISVSRMDHLKGIPEPKLPDHLLPVVLDVDIFCGGLDIDGYVIVFLFCVDVRFLHDLLGAVDAHGANDSAGLVNQNMVMDMW
ncbi:hypothetical protein BAE44_0006514 [Dichanthelium oligosanthes]|uniref:Uncharacterized protein n=1 Tax=Dichanthelium oligosanthes TaxID=888268 RepID=A0A1E5W5C3_9POAL|nr:hypothetical protein BAE44_0006514 [Dichanthelium oligosanthes]